MRTLVWVSIFYLLMVCGSGSSPANSKWYRFTAFIESGAIGEDQNPRSLMVANMECISCHDGIMGSDVSLAGAGEQKMMSWNRRGWNHPVGMNYNDSYIRKNGGLAPKGTLPQEIILINDEVACLSCHRLKSNIRRALERGFPEWKSSSDCTSSKFMTTGRNTKNLCTSCHVK